MQQTSSNKVTTYVMYTLIAVAAVFLFFRYLYRPILPFFLRMDHRFAIAIACADLGATYWVGSAFFFGHTCFGFYRSIRGVVVFVI